MQYHEVLAAWNQRLSDSLEKAKRLGYSRFIAITDGNVTVPSVPNVFMVKHCKEWREVAKKAKNTFNWVAGLPKKLGEARDMCNSRLVDIIIIDPRREPYFDYVCAKYLKERNGGVLIPISWLFRRESLRNLRWTSLQAKIAFKTAIPVISGSLAEKPEEIPSPRQARAILTELLGLSDGQALLSLTTFPKYFFSKERALARKGAIKGEV